MPAQGVEVPKLTKDQYDDLMNFLDAYRPIGAEAVTRDLRRFVHGFSGRRGGTGFPAPRPFNTTVSTVSLGAGPSDRGYHREQQHQLYATVHAQGLDRFRRSVQAGGSNGINIRMHQIEAEFDVLWKVIAQINENFPQLLRLASRQIFHPWERTRLGFWLQAPHKKKQTRLVLAAGSVATPGWREDAIFDDLRFEERQRRLFRCRLTQ